jgi:hypothetical protein
MKIRSNDLTGGAAGEILELQKTRRARTGRLAVCSGFSQLGVDHTSCLDARGLGAAH